MEAFDNTKAICNCNYPYLKAQSLTSMKWPIESSVYVDVAGVVKAGGI
jgi:hypothetical protein